MITSFDRSNLRTVRADLDAALAAVTTKHGITFIVGNMRFTPGDFKATLTAHASTTASIGSTDELPTGAEQVVFANLAVRFGVKPTDYNRALTIRGKAYRLVGIRPQAIQYPFICITPHGGRYKFGAADVLAALSGSTAPAPQSDSLEDAKTRTKITNICGEIEKHNKMDVGGNFEAWNADYQRIDKMIDDLQAELGRGYKVGKMLKFQKADGYALYLITHTGPNTTRVAHLNLGDGWHSEAVHNGTIRTATARAQVNVNDNLAAIFADHKERA